MHVGTCQPQNFGVAKPRDLSYSTVICIWLNVLPVVHLNRKPCRSCSKGNDNFQIFPTGIVRYTPRYYWISVLGPHPSCSRSRADFSFFFQIFRIFFLIHDFLPYQNSHLVTAYCESNNY